ncbi:MAG: ABC transporter ATP-binding protein [Legionella sp.]|uniref:ABC transporter ATP-binding protein n=1 Tax=Legionella sp. TaxID=459 RepID=UPI0039E36250
MSSRETVIEVKGLSKCYRIYDKPYERLLQMLTRSRRSYGSEFWALRDVSFEIKKGETIGIIGQNGSGKSTRLQMICGTLTPTTGHISTKGRIAALLELGCGFNPEFTGRENVYMNAAMLGLSKDEIDACFDDILAFADIGNFIEQPTKTYSSGMNIRLAFAVQAQVTPDILIVDEALAVGDAKFQAKCFDRLNQLREQGTSILLVTHDSSQIVTHCSRAILLNSGRIMEEGESRHIVNCYHDLLFGKAQRALPKQELPLHSGTIKPKDTLSITEDLFSTRPSYNPYEYRWGDGAAQILDYSLYANEKLHPSAISSGDFITLRITMKFLTDVIRPILGITIKTKEGVTIYGVNSETLNADEFKTLGALGDTIQSEISFPCRLSPGDYFISLGIASSQGAEIIPHDRRYDAIHLHVLPPTNFFGLVDLGLKLTTQELSA